MIMELHADLTPLLLRVGEAGQRLNIGRSVMYELIRSGRLRSVKVGRLRLIPTTALTEFVEQLGKGRCSMTTRRSRGEGSLFWHERRQRWIAEVTIGYDGRGKRKYEEREWTHQDRGQEQAPRGPPRSRGRPRDRAGRLHRCQRGERVARVWRPPRRRKARGRTTPPSCKRHVLHSSALAGYAISLRMKSIGWLAGSRTEAEHSIAPPCARVPKPCRLDGPWLETRSSEMSCRLPAFPAVAKAARRSR